MLGIWLQVSKWFHKWANYLKMKVLTDQFLNVTKITDISLDEQWIIAMSMLGVWLHKYVYGFTSVQHKFLGSVASAMVSDPAHPVTLSRTHRTSSDAVLCCSDLYTFVHL